MRWLMLAGCGYFNWCQRVDIQDIRKTHICLLVHQTFNSPDSCLRRFCLNPVHRYLSIFTTARTFGPAWAEKRPAILSPAWQFRFSALAHVSPSDGHSSAVWSKNSGDTFLSLGWFQRFVQKRFGGSDYLRFSVFLETDPENIVSSIFIFVAICTFPPNLYTSSSSSALHYLSSLHLLQAQFALYVRSRKKTNKPMSTR